MKRLMIFLLIIGCFVMGVCFAGDETLDEIKSQQQGALGSTGNGQLDDVVVTESVKKGIDSSKPQLVIELDHFSLISHTLKTEKFVLDKRSGNPEQLRVTSEPFLQSQATYAPWHSDIIEPPIAVFKLGNKKIEVDEWQFVITDPSGRPFKKYSGNGLIPLSLEWDGRDDKSRMLNVGNTYSYVLHYIYKGNKKDIIGQPFSINALLHQERTGLYVSLALSSVFDTSSIINKILDNGEVLIRESADILKEYYSAPITVIVYSESDETALEQAKKIRTRLAEELIMSEDKIKIEGYLDMPENFHVDIVVKNR